MRNNIDWDTRSKKTSLEPKLNATSGVDFSAAISIIQGYINDAKKSIQKSITDEAFFYAKGWGIIAERDAMKSYKHRERNLATAAADIAFNTSKAQPGIRAELLKLIEDWEKDIDRLGDQKRIADISQANIELAGHGVDGASAMKLAEAQAEALRIAANAQAANDQIIAKTKSEIIKSSSNNNRIIIISVIIIILLTTGYIIWKKRKA